MDDSTRTVAPATIDGPTLPTAEGPRASVSTPSGFELLDEVGSGGMGVVYRARDRELNREVAVKVLHSKYHLESASGRRFVAEAQITGQLQHPGIPPVYRVGELPDGRPFLAMKLIDGKTLSDLLKEEGAASAKWLGVFEAVCQAVGYAHAHGVIHRDLKPQNIMVGAFGEVQVMDWGLSKVLAASRERERPEAEADPEATRDSDPTEIKSLRDADLLTHYGSILGTPAYMAPEQAIGAIDEIDRRTDVFGLGAILCSLLTGQPPYSGGSARSALQQAAGAMLAEAFVRLDNCGADPNAVALCKWCLSGQPANRPADAGVVAKAVAGLRTAAAERVRHTDTEATERWAEQRVKKGMRRLVYWVAATGIVATLVTFVICRQLSYVEQQKAVTAEQDRAFTAHRSVLQKTELFVEQLTRVQGKSSTADNVIRYRNLWVQFADQQPYFKNSDCLEEGLRRTGDLWAKLNQWEDAREEYEAALKVAGTLGYSRQADAHRRLGTALEKLGRTAEAEKEYAQEQTARERMNRARE